MRSKAQIIPNRGELKRKAVNYKTGMDIKLDEATLKKMEQLVENSSAQFLDETVESLKGLREALGRAATEPAARREVLEHIREEAFQIKGMGGVFGYPLLTEFAKSLHDFLKELEDLDELQQEIVSIHVDTLYVVVSHRIKGSGGALEAQLRASLKAAVDKAKPGTKTAP
ncbi:MAG: Hpt domain-containing protein [Ferrovibrio sp.]|uniref:Hpt domain-containing protein n=1 Tax=Ferrovibrio sp. TaxID=1917215 RepID=UPI002617EF4C|nr:Hpt domain-containing protein [Ferrovibrio sp.]MCW0235912.1 Hpt domain-containing protein [Ferrovibrio sp.]